MLIMAHKYTQATTPNMPTSVCMSACMCVGVCVECATPAVCNEIILSVD